MSWNFIVDVFIVQYIAGTTGTLYVVGKLSGKSSVTVVNVILQIF